jgi:hypothetical protein
MQIHSSALARNIDLFPDTVADLYPQAPGYVKGSDTSREAAEAFKEPAHTIANRVLAEYIKAHPAGLTSNEVADRLGLTLINVRPRCAELHTGGFLTDSGQRRALSSGRRGAVLTLSDWSARTMLAEVANAR